MPSRKRRQRGHVEELPSGSYRAMVYAGIDPLTRRQRYLRATVGTYEQAQVELTRLQREVDQGRHPKSSATVSEVVAQWMDIAKLEDTTRERYGDLIRIYIGPILGDLQAAKLDVATLERLYAQLQRCKERCGGRRRAGHVCRPLAGSTVRKIHYILSGALETAVRWEHLGVNKAALAVPPASARPNPDPPSVAEAAAVLSAAWVDPEWGMLLWLSMVTGARRGEVVALRWRHLEIAKGVLWVRRNQVQPKVGAKEKDPKSGGRRPVALDPHTLGLLAAHRARLLERCAELEVEPGPDAWLFSPEPDGSKPYQPRYLTQRYRRLAKKLKLSSTRLHSLRHYSATELIAAGVDLRTVAGRLGHGSGGATTLKMYAAWVDQAGERAATTMGELMPRIVPATPEPRGPYQVIAAALREQIRAGELKPGEELPTLAEIAAAHNVSVGPAQRAVALLRDEGLVEVSRGRRAKVSPKAAELLRPAEDTAKGEQTAGE
jgi:integrase